MITAFAALTIGMMFIERGALKSSRGGALWFFRLVTPFAELIISIIPGITLVTWIQIKMSRIADKTLPETVHTSLRYRQKRSFKKKKAGYKKTITHEKEQIKKYAKGRGKRAYGKGRRGVETLARKTGQHAKIVRGTAKRSVASARRRMSSAKLTQ